MKPSYFARQTTRYTVVGAMCAIANNLVMIVGDRAGIHYFPMSILSFLLVTPFGYLLHSGFTFGEPRSFRAFLRFSSGVALGFPIYLITMAILCTGLSLSVVVATSIATVLLFLWNYASAHWAIQRCFENALGRRPVKWAE